MVRIAIIGAGMSGISLSLMLSKKYSIKIFEKSDRAGGRMSTRRISPFIFDHGAQYFKINDPDFKKFLSPLIAKKIIKPWLCKYIKIIGKNIIKKETWNIRKKYYVGVPNMDSIVKYLAKDCNISLETKINSVKKIKDKWHLFDENKTFLGQYDWVVYAIPIEQTCSMISRNISFYFSISSIKMIGCYSLMLGMNQSLKLDYDVALIENEDISWLAVNNSKPERKSGYSLLINSSYNYAKKNIHTPKERVLNHLLNTTSTIIKKDLSEAKIKNLHQWRYVETKQYPKENYFIDKIQKIALCGDWCINSRVEGAFISAKELSETLNNIKMN